MKTLTHFGFMTIAAGLFVAQNAAAQIAVSIGEPPVCPYGYYEVTTAFQMATMARSGSPAVYSSAPDLGSTGRIVSTDTSIIVWTFARATAVLCPRAARVQRNTAQSFTARQCMTHVVMRRPVDAGK